jgi:Lrp/AsnC family leucine-responsive transcriptional regulator
MPDATPRQLDDVGWAILHALQENARLSFTEIGRRVALSSTAVAERVRQMEEAGYIVGYRAEVDPAKLGYPLMAFVYVGPPKPNYRQLRRRLDDVPEVVECHRVTGRDAFVVKVRAASVERLEEVLDALSPTGPTATSLVLSSVRTRRSIQAPPAPRRD